MRYEPYSSSCFVVSVLFFCFGLQLQNPHRICGFPLAQCRQGQITDSGDGMVGAGMVVSAEYMRDRTAFLKYRTECGIV